MLFQIQNLKFVMCIFCILLSASVLARGQSDNYFSLVEINVHSSDAALKKRLHDYAVKKVIQIERTAVAEPGQGVYLLNIFAERTDAADRREYYVMTSSIGKKATCAYADEKPTPPVNCMSLLGFTTLSLVEPIDVFPKMDEFITALKMSAIRPDRPKPKP